MGAPIVVVGVDLAGSPRRATGICTLRAMQVETADVFSDREILDWIRDAGPRVVGIDAPLTLPPGRRSLGQRNAEHLRACDRELIRRGIRFFPVTLGPMRMLTRRGMRLAERLRRLGYAALEVFPGGAQDVWGLPRKQHGLEALRRGLRRLGVRGVRNAMSNDELDAVSAALVCRQFVQGHAEILGDRNLAPFVMPRGKP